MSLTQILAEPEVAAAFGKYVRIPSPVPSAPKMIVPPRHHSSYALVGTAFDYCLRFCLAACNRAIVSEQMWVAEIALKLMETEETLPPGLSLEQATKGVRRARQLYAEFLEKRAFTRPLARAALFLAALDKFYREGVEAIVVRYLKEPLEAETEDCLRLVRAIPREVITATKRAALNPTFGDASALVGGADADFVIDDTLVDIKTTKYFELTPMMVHQLIGYRIMLAACGAKGSTASGQPIVTHGAIYFSRHARLERFPYAELIERRHFIALSEWFISYVAEDTAEAELFLSRIAEDELF